MAIARIVGKCVARDSGHICRSERCASYDPAFRIYFDLGVVAVRYAAVVQRRRERQRSSRSVESRTGAGHASSQDNGGQNCGLVYRQDPPNGEIIDIPQRVVAGGSRPGSNLLWYISH